MQDEAWVDEAACRQIPPTDRDRIFFPDRTGSNIEAKLICQSCPVCRACLEFAIATGEHFGVWGGTGERERQRIVRARRRGQPDPEIRWPSAETVERLERHGRPPPQRSSTRSVAEEVGAAHARAQARLTRSAAVSKNANAVALGRLGGKKGGRARAEKLSPERRREIASQAARVRWLKDRPIPGDAAARIDTA